MSEFICNTSPLQYLHQLGLLDILPTLTDGVTVPPAVVDELRAGRSTGPVLDQLHILGFRLDARTRQDVLELAGEAS